MLIFSAQSALAKPLQLAPVNDWRLLRNDASCELIRKFGAGDEALTLLLELSGPEAHFSFSAFGEPLKRVGRKEVDLRFGPAEQATRRSYAFGKDGRGTPFIIMHGVRLAPIAGPGEGALDGGWLGEEREAAINELTLSRAVSDPITLELGPMGEHLRQIRTCAGELFRRLENGSNGVGFSREPTPITDPGNWLTSADYPTGLVWNDVEGRVEFRLVIDGKGKPVACHIENVTNSDVFNDRVCTLLIRRAQFEPALDGNGKPVAAYWHSSVRFVAN